MVVCGDSITWVVTKSESIYGGRRKNGFLFPFWDQWIPPVKVAELWKLYRLSNKILCGLCP